MKRLPLLFTALALLFLAACGSGGGSRAGAAAPTASDIIDGAAETAAPSAPALADPADAAETSAPDLSSPDADVDLTTLSSTMVYAEVSQMVYYPEDYIGKTVKMQGQFAVYEGADRNYYACLISDATACCQNGIEFDPAGAFSYPEDFPEPGSDITVTGVFGFYEEDGFQYLQLADAVMIF